MSAEVCRLHHYVMCQWWQQCSVPGDPCGWSCKCCTGAQRDTAGTPGTGHLCNKPGAERRHETWRAAAARSSHWRCCSPSRWTRPRPGGGGCWCGGRSRCRPPTPRSPAAAASRGRGGWSGGGWCRPRPHRSCSPPRRRCRNTNPSPSTRQWRPNLTPSRDVSSWIILITL